MFDLFRFFRLLGSELLESFKESFKRPYLDLKKGWLRGWLLYGNFVIIGSPLRGFLALFL